MQYMLMIYGTEGSMTKEDGAKMMSAYISYTEAMKKAGAFVAGDPLQSSSTASTVRMKDGKSKVLNGPYTESKEQLGGYYIIEAKDIDAAISWAAKCPGAQHGTIEVRPIMAYSM
jgi:hypothetical protein